MGIRKINPTSPGQRGMTKSDYQDITTSTPEKSLLKPLRKILKFETKNAFNLFIVSIFVGRVNCCCDVIESCIIFCR